MLLAQLPVSGKAMLRIISGGLQTWECPLKLGRVNKGSILDELSAGDTFKTTK
jgi:hypothetical protein